MTTCGTCRFFYQEGAANMQAGVCRRYPPTLFMLMQPAARLAGISNGHLGPQPVPASTYPPVGSGFWCGEHQARAAVEAAA